MAGAKKFMKQHDDDLEKLSSILADAHRLYLDSSISPAEFVGTLEMAKFYVMNSNLRAFHACIGGGGLADLISEIFGDDEDEGDDDAE